MLAARALGLDCGPMSGFDNGVIDEAFFAGTAIKSNFLGMATRRRFFNACRVSHSKKLASRFKE